MSLAPSRGRQSRTASGSLSSTFGDTSRRAHDDSTASVSYPLANVVLLSAGMLFGLVGVFITLVTLQPLFAALFLVSLLGLTGVAVRFHRKRSSQSRRFGSTTAAAGFVARVTELGSRRNVDTDRL